VVLASPGALVWRLAVSADPKCPDCGDGDPIADHGENPELIDEGDER